MVMSERDLDKLAEDIYRDRLIATSLYCSECGYNLRTLPYVYRCPECGHGYNARPGSMEGIFLPSRAEFPLMDAVGMLFFGMIAFSLVLGGLSPVNEGRLIVGAVFVGLAAYFGVLMFRRITPFLRYRSIARHIAMTEEH